MEKLQEFESFVAGVFLSSTGGRERMTLTDASATLREWAAEGVEFPEGLTPLMYAAIWNNMLRKEV